MFEINYYATKVTIFENVPRLYFENMDYKQKQSHNWK